jgi:hypothetical protein
LGPPGEKERIERRLSRIKFIDTEKYFPRDFVFGRGAKMEEIGYRWCPYSFMSCSPWSNRGGADRWLTKTKEGLEGQFSGFIIQEKGRQMRPSFNLVVEATGEEFKVVRVVEGPEEAQPRSWLEDLDNPIILCDDINLDRRFMGAEFVGVMRPAFVGDIVREDSDMTYVKFHCLARISIATDSDMTEVSDEALEYGDRVLSEARSGARADAEQQPWLVPLCSATVQHYSKFCIQ